MAPVNKAFARAIDDPDFDFDKEKEFIPDDEEYQMFVAGWNAANEYRADLVYKSNNFDIVGGLFLVLSVLLSGSGTVMFIDGTPAPYFLLTFILAVASLQMSREMDKVAKARRAEERKVFNAKWS